MNVPKLNHIDTMKLYTSDITYPYSMLVTSTTIFYIIHCQHTVHSNRMHKWKLLYCRNQ